MGKSQTKGANYQHLTAFAFVDSGLVHTYPDFFEFATFSFRIHKFPRPHVAYISGLAVDFAECVWTEAVSGKKKLRIQKYPIRVDRASRLSEIQPQEKSSTPTGTPEFNSHKATRVQLPQRSQSSIPTGTSTSPSFYCFLGHQYGCHDENTLKILYHFGTVCFICYFHSELSITSRVQARYVRESLPR